MSEEKKITNILFQILFPKETGKGQKSLYKSENRKRERASLTQESKLSPINSNESAITALGLFGRL